MKKIGAMDRDFVAKASIVINAPVDEVWKALTDPAVIKQYMFETTVVSDWREGSAIVWKGEWQGTKYEDKGVILQLKPKRLIQYSHFNPLSGKLDLLENYHRVTVELVSDGASTTVLLSQDNNETEKERQHSEKNWRIMLDALRKLLEK